MAGLGLDESGADEKAVLEADVQRGGLTTLVEGSRAHRSAKSLRYFGGNAEVQSDFCF